MILYVCIYICMYIYIYIYTCKSTISPSYWSYETHLANERHRGSTTTAASSTPATTSWTTPWRSMATAGESGGQGKCCGRLNRDLTIKNLQNEQLTWIQTGISSKNRELTGKNLQNQLSNHGFHHGFHYWHPDSNIKIRICPWKKMVKAASSLVKSRLVGSWCPSCLGFAIGHWGMGIEIPFPWQWIHLMAGKFVAGGPGVSPCLTTGRATEKLGSHQGRFCLPVVKHGNGFFPPLTKKIPNRSP